MLMPDPPIVMLDEPFAGVHPMLCRFMIEQIEAMARRRQDGAADQPRPDLDLPAVDPGRRAQPGPRHRRRRRRRDPRQSRRDRSLSRDMTATGRPPAAMELVDVDVAYHGDIRILQGLSLAGPAGHDHRRDRPQRRGQVDGAAHALRPAEAGGGRRADRRPDGHRPAAVALHRARHRAGAAASQPVQRAVGRRQPAARLLVVPPRPGARRGRAGARLRPVPDAARQAPRHGRRHERRPAALPRAGPGARAAAARRSCSTSRRR